MRYPAEPPTVDEIVAVMRHTGDTATDWRLRTMIVVLWRAGLRIQEALALAEDDLAGRFVACREVARRGLLTNAPAVGGGRWAGQPRGRSRASGSDSED